MESSMLRSTVLSRLSNLASRRLPASTLAFGLAVSLLALPACGKKKGEETAAPGEGKSADQVKADIAKAKQAAKVSELIVLANKDLNNGRHKAAAKLAEDALAENPNNADAYTVLGASRWRAGDFEGSTEALRKALELDPKNFGAALSLARNLQTVGKHLEAAQLQDKILADEPDQLDPWLVKLWSYYALCDADNAVKTIDKISPLMGKTDALLPLVQFYAAYMRPFEGKGPLCAIKGDKGGSNLDFELAYGLKYAGATLGKEFAQVIFMELREESAIDPKLVKTLGLKELGKYKVGGTDDEVGLVLIPEIKFGELSITNVPASVLPLDAYADSMGGEAPGVILGRQAMHAFGAITFDFPAHTLELAKAAPKGPAEGEVELPMLMVSIHLEIAPLVPLRIDGSDHRFFAFFGNTFASGLAVSKKDFLKSGHLPREVAAPEDPEAGLKMVYLDGFSLGDKDLLGTSGVVLVNDPPDPVAEKYLRAAAFEIGGHINLNLLHTWRATYALGEGKVYIKPS
jgi:tetratricopeptide (TPR) repeat protein